MASQNPTSESGRRVASATRGGLGLYFVLLLVQTTGAAIVMINGLPIYRQMIGDVSKHQPQPGILWWAGAAVALIQVAYWVRVRLRPPLPHGGRILMGRLAGFVARLSFVFAGSTFALVFLLRFEQLSLPPDRSLMLLALLFCWTLELERLAKALYTGEEKP